MGSKYVDDFQFPAEFGFSGSAKGRHDSKDEKFVDEDEYGDGSYVGRQKKAIGGSAKIMKPRARLPGLPKMPMMGKGPAAFADGGDVDPGDMGAPAPTGALNNQASGPAPTVKKGQNREPLITMPLSKAQQLGQELIKRGAMAGAKHGAMLGQQMGERKAMMGMAQAAKAKQMAAQAPTQPQQMKSLQSGAPSQPPASPMQGPPMGHPPMPPPRPPGPPAGGPPAMAHGGHFIQGAIKHPGRMQHGAAREGVSTHQYMAEHQHAPGSLGAAARLGLRMTGGDLSPHKKGK